MPQGTAVAGSSDEQRYFVVQFTKTAIEGDVNVFSKDKKGYWYIHFDGQRVAKQIEWNPDKPPTVMIAGRDDLQMCELTLDETGLTRKGGNEISENEFNREWEKAIVYVRNR